MKKILFVVFMVFATTLGYSQLHLGLKGSWTMNKLSTDQDQIISDAKAGFNIGAFVRVGKKFHIQPEAYFSSQPGHLHFTFLYENEGRKVNVSEDFKINNLDVPLLLGYKIVNLKKINVRLQAGPVLSLALNKTVTVSFDGVEQPDNSQIADDLDDFTWAAQFGAGADFLFLTLDVRYQLGLADFYNETGNAGSNYATLKNNIFIVSLGWKIF